jgi:hydrogenase/urease accessory protein HupE
VTVGRRLYIFLVVLVMAVGGAFGGRAARAHELQPAYLELTQRDATHVEVVWKVPARSEVERALRPVFPPDCKVTAGPERAAHTDTVTERFTLKCPAGLDGHHIEIDGLATTLADVIVRVVRPDGAAVVTRLNPATTGFEVEAAPGPLHLAATYTRLGVEHILMGVDHLLFVLGLLLVVKDWRMLLKTITSFTIAHSITLGIATLGYASAPLPPLNAAIALSILFLGPEIVRARRGQTSLTIEHPWVVAFAFGLLHGFGFASGLTALGLSRGEIPLALLLFNVGVEIGQLFFVFLILALGWSFRRLLIQWPVWAQWLPAYTVGGLGAYWTIQRVAILLGGLR